MKWDTPARSSRSSREPAPIQNPNATERTLGTRSEITLSPESSYERVYFCTGRSYPRPGNRRLGPRSSHTRLTRVPTRPLLGPSLSVAVAGAQVSFATKVQHLRRRQRRIAHAA